MEFKHLAAKVLNLLLPFQRQASQARVSTIRFGPAINRPRPRAPPIRSFRQHPIHPAVPRFLGKNQSQGSATKRAPRFSLSSFPPTTRQSQNVPTYGSVFFLYICLWLSKGRRKNNYHFGGTLNLVVASHRFWAFSGLVGSFFTNH